MDQDRLQRLQEETLEHGLDGLALVPGPNMAYVSGIRAHLSERPIVLFLPVDDEPAIIIPRLEASKAEEAGLASERIFVWSDEEGYTGAFQQACAFLELSDFLLGVESLRMRVLELEMLQRYAPGLSTVYGEEVLDTVRISKDAQEVAALERAVAIAEGAMEQLLPYLRPGLTEKQVAAMLSRELLEMGSGPLPFQPIVSAGPNGASPHAVPTDRPLDQGDLLIIDWGATVDGYGSIDWFVRPMRPAGGRHSRAPAGRRSIALPAPSSTMADTASTSSTARAMGWAWRPMKAPKSWKVTTNRWRRAPSSPWSPESTYRGAAACASRTT